MSYTQTRLTPLEESTALARAGIDPDMATWDDLTLERASVTLDAAQAEKIEMASRRVRHVRIAAENLMAADMQDLAHDLMQKADGMERDVVAAKEELMHRMQKHGGERPEGDRGEVQALRNENQRLNAELNELRQMVEKLRNDR